MSEEGVIATLCLAIYSRQPMDRAMAQRWHFVEFEKVRERVSILVHALGGMLKYMLKVHPG